MEDYMQDHRSNKCPRCHRSYTSATHRRQCRGMTRTQAKAGRSRRYSRQSCSGPDMGRILAIHAGSRIVADGSFFADREVKS